MHKFKPTINDNLEYRISLSNLNTTAVIRTFDDPLPAPEPPPGTDPGTGTPIITAPIPPSGPIGPGTS